MKNISELVGEKLFHLRNSKNISQVEMARILQCSQRAISYWESGKREIPFNKLLEICEYFKVDMNYLFSREATADPGIAEQLKEIKNSIREMKIREDRIEEKLNQFVSDRAGQYNAGR